MNYKGQKLNIFTISLNGDVGIQTYYCYITCIFLVKIRHKCIEKAILVSSLLTLVVWFTLPLCEFGCWWCFICLNISKNLMPANINHSHEIRFGIINLILKKKKVVVFFFFLDLEFNHLELGYSCEKVMCEASSEKAFF